MAVTAKIHCASKVSSGGQSVLTFAPDYADPRNAAWAAATPHLSLTMTVKDYVAPAFEAGKSYTLTFEPEPDESEESADDAEESARPQRRRR